MIAVTAKAKNIDDSINNQRISFKIEERNIDLIQDGKVYFKSEEGDYRNTITFGGKTYSDVKLDNSWRDSI